MKISYILRPSNRSLIRELVASDFKLRYQNSILGYLWSLLRPLMLFGILYIVFTYFIPIGKDIPHFPAYLLLGLVMWTFFVEATVSGLNAITGRGDMIRKVSIPKYTIVISSTISAFINFCLNMVVVFVVMILNGVEIRPTVLLMPFIILELIALSMALAFLLSALYVKFRDLSHIWEVVIQLLFYATPLIYLLNKIPEKFAKIVSLNPLAQIIQDARAFMITPNTMTTKQIYDSQLIGRGLPIFIIFVLSMLAIWYFRKSSGSFAEDL